MCVHAAHRHKPPPATPPLRYRKSVTNLIPAQLTALRGGFSALEGISDNRGYGYLAGIHGLPLQYCQHGTPLFLPWHRAYLYIFERFMRDRQPAAMLAWWDWTSSTSHASGLPSVYTDTQAGGQTNPLYQAEVPPAARQGGQPTETFRRQPPSDPAKLPTATQVDAVLALSDFFDFSNHLEDLHNQVHGWVGGTMGIIPWAAFDPIFWAHHAMIDRIWRLWQLRHPQSLLPPAFLNQALPPFPLTVRQTLNVLDLGYDYASASNHVILPATSAAKGH